MNPLDVAYEQFIEDFPEFSQVPAGAVNRQLAMSNTLSRSAWGRWWTFAVELFTAHYLAVRFKITSAINENGLNNPYDAANVTTNKSANTNGISEGNAPSQLLTGENPITADLARTEYGLEYLSLMNMVVAPGNIVYSPMAAAAAWRDFPGSVELPTMAPGSGRFGPLQ